MGSIRLTDIKAASTEYNEYLENHYKQHAELIEEFRHALITQLECLPAHLRQLLFHCEEREARPFPDKEEFATRVGTVTYLDGSTCAVFRLILVQEVAEFLKAQNNETRRWYIHYDRRYLPPEHTVDFIAVVYVEDELARFDLPGIRIAIPLADHADEMADLAAETARSIFRHFKESRFPNIHGQATQGTLGFSLPRD